MKRTFFFAFGVTLAMVAAVAACPSPMTTFRHELKNAVCIVEGSFDQPVKVNNTDTCVTPVHIHSVFKSHAAVAKATTIIIEREMSADAKKYLVFFDIYKGKLEAYRGEVASPAAVEYLKKISGLKNAKEVDNLRFFYDHLHHEDPTIIQDVLMEFGLAEYNDVRALAKTLSADQIAATIEKLLSEKADEFRDRRVRQYAVLLGLCGKLEHARVVHKIIEDLDNSKQIYSWRGELLAVYWQLDEFAGWKLLLGALTEKDFLARYGVYKAVDFVREHHPKHLSKNKRDKLTGLFLAQSDMADFWIEHLRRHKDWDLTGKVLALWYGEKEQPPIVKRAIVRFALRNPEAMARDFIVQQRQRDPVWVNEVEEILDLSEPPAK